MPPTITAAITCYDEEAAQIRAAVDSLLGQTRPPFEILIMDNGPEGRLAAEMDGYAPHVKAMRSGGNLGYIALNRAAERATGDYLLCLNPDAHAELDCLERMAAVADADPTVALVGAQILLEDGRTRNAGANPLHPTGISPSDGYGQPREDGEPRDAMVASGACFLAPLDTYRDLGGFVEEFFLYYEDVNLSWRARLAGMRVVYCPRAAVRHSYEFGARPFKWYLLERNRLFTLMTNYEIRTLLLLAPLLLATELGVMAVAARDGWLREKLRAYRSLLGLRREIADQRRRVQASRRRTDAELLPLFQDRLDAGLISAGRARLANLFCVPYMRLVRGMLGV